MVAACTTAPWDPSQAMIVVAPSKSLAISQVRADMVDGQTVVRGRVARRALLGGAVRGHLHVEARSGPRVVAWADTRWTQLARRRLPTSSFQVRLPVTAVPFDTIRVAHVLTGHRKPRAAGTQA